MIRKTACAVIGCVLLVGCSSAPPKPSARQGQDPSRLTYTRLYCSPDNESHFETAMVELGRVDAAPPAPPFFAKGNVATAGGCLSAPYLAAWLIARSEGIEAAKSALHYVAAVGEKDEYVARAMRNIQPYLPQPVAEPA